MGWFLSAEEILWFFYSWIISWKKGTGLEIWKVKQRKNKKQKQDEQIKNAPQKQAFSGIK